MSRNVAEKIRLIVNGILIFVCCFMIFDGVELFMQTWGMVQSTESQMLIMVVHILSVMMIWASVYTFKKIIVGIITKKDMEVS